MSTLEFMNYLAGQNITLKIEEGNIRFKAPRGAVTKKIIEQLREKKQEIMEILNEQEKMQNEEKILTADSSAKHDPFPLTGIQQAYWIGRSGAFELGNIATHNYFELKKHHLDIEALNRAWWKVVQRHDMLRAVILPDGTQQILREVPYYEFEVNDLRGKSRKEAEAITAEVRKEMSHQVMDPQQWPLFDIRISLLDKSEALIHVSLDYIFADAASQLLVFNEWHLVYSGREHELSPLSLSFRDYVLENERMKKTAEYERARNYWYKRVSDFPLSPRFPFKKDTRQIVSPQFSRHVSKLEAPLWDKLKEKARESRLTPSGILQAAFAVIISFFSNTKRFALNLTLFNRLPLHPEITRMVGEFTSLVLLEVDYRKKESFIKKAERLHRQLLDDLDHRQVSGVEVLRELVRVRGENEKIIMPVVFTSALGFASVGHDVLVINKLGEMVYNISQTPQVWLDHQIMEQEGALIFNWDTVDGVFPDGFVDVMFDSYCGLLKRLVEDESSWNSYDFDFLPDLQKNRRIEVNNTAAPVSGKLLHSLFIEQVEKDPGKTAVITTCFSLSYRETYSRASRIAASVYQNGVSKGDLVGVCMNKGWEQVVTVLGILMAGAAYIPIDPGLPEERIQFLLENAQVSQIYIQSDLSSLIQWPRELKVISSDTLDLQENWSLPPVNQNDEDLAYVIFTSGSTGQPKGVMINHRGAVNTILDINDRFNINSGDKVLAISSLSFDLSVYDIFGILAAGGTIVIPDDDKRIDPGHWCELIEMYHITIWNSVPALFQMYIDEIENKPHIFAGSLRTCLLSGDWIPVDLPGRSCSRIKDLQVVSLGGATEASIWSIIYPVVDATEFHKSVPYGKPMRNQQFYVLDDDLSELPDWVTGELYIGGTGLAIGYWKDQKKTGASFIIHPRTGQRLYKTGDVGCYLPDGNIQFQGRQDFQVKIKGYRIELGEIESTLKNHPLVDSSVVLVNTTGGKSKRLVAYVKCAEKGDDVGGGLEKYLREKLPEYMVPADFVFVDSIPLTPTGKINRKYLASLKSESSTILDDYSPPRNIIEQKLVDIWDFFLDKKTGIYDSFFPSGGDSLIATKIVLKIRETFHIEMGLPDFFDAVNVAGLARLIEEYKRGTYSGNTNIKPVSDLLSEVKLEPSINAAGLVSPDVTESSGIFLTGATGFVGAFLLSELLNRTKGLIYCLVRANSDEQAMKRIKENLTHYSLWNEAMQNRIQAVAGDLSQPMFGLTEKRFDGLEKSVDVIYHNGAWVHFVYSYDVLKPANVSGTVEVLKLAVRGKVKPIHYISTTAVFSDYGFTGSRVVLEDEDLDSSGILDTGYAQSKWVAEKMLVLARSRGLPVSVYRLGMVTGDSVNGYANLEDYILRMLKGCIQVGSIPDIDFHLDFVPVDYVCKAIVELSYEKEIPAGNFHLIHPQKIPVSKLLDWIRSRGYVLDRTDYTTWRKQLDETSGGENALLPLLPLLPAELPPEEISGQLILKQDKTLSALDKVEVTFPELDELLFDTYYNYLVKSGFLPKVEERV